MSDFTKGRWFVCGINKTTVMSNDSYRVVCSTHMPECDDSENQSNAHFIAAAFTAATRAEEMGYDGVRALEALPELLHAAELREALRQKGLLFASRHLVDEEHEAGPIALAQARKED